MEFDWQLKYLTADNDSLKENYMIKRILVPVDGSQFARNGLFHAINIAKVFASKIYVIRTIDPENFSSVVFTSSLHKNNKLREPIREFALLLKNQARKDLLADVAICKSNGVDASYDILSGKPTETILKFVRGKKIELIVMGSHGLSGIKRLKVMGSVSRGVSELASCPVMIIH